MQHLYGRAHIIKNGVVKKNVRKGGQMLASPLIDREHIRGIQSLSQGSGIVSDVKKRIKPLSYRL